MSEGVKFGPSHGPEIWREVGDGVEVLISGTDFVGVIHVRRNGEEKDLHFDPGGQFDWTPVGEGIEVRTPPHEIAGTVYVRHRTS